MEKLFVRAEPHQWEILCGASSSIVSIFTMEVFMFVLTEENFSIMISSNCITRLMMTEVWWSTVFLHKWQESTHVKIRMEFIFTAACTSMCIVSSIDSAKHLIRSFYRTRFSGFENTKPGFQFRVWVCFGAYRCPSYRVLRFGFRTQLGNPNTCMQSAFV